MSDMKKWKQLVESASKTLAENPVEDTDYTDHEVSMAKSQLLSTVKSATRIAKHLKNLSEEEGLEGWVASKITMAEDYLQAVADYMDGQEINEAFGNPEPTPSKSGYPANIDSLQSVKRKIAAGRMDLADALINSMIGRLMHDNNTEESVTEGYKILPQIDKDKYPEINGLEGPFRTLNGAVVYYDPKEGKYYDKDRDMYLSYEEFRQMDTDYSGMKDERDIPVKEAKGLASIDWPDEDMAKHAENAIRHGMHAYDAYGHVYSMTYEREWMQDHKDELIKMFASYGLETE